MKIKGRISGGEETTAAFDAKIIMSDGKLSVLVPVKDKETGEIRSQPVVSEVRNIVTTSTQLDIPEELDTRLLIMSVDVWRQGLQRVTCE